MQVIKDSTDITTYFVLRDSTNHDPKTDVTVTDIDLYYVTYKAAISAKADVTALAAADSAHADNKAFHVGQGAYRIDWPDIWTGAVGTTVQLIVVCSGVDTTFLEVEITDPAQTGDSYAIVNHADYGNAKLVRSTTPANTLSVDANNLVGVPATQDVNVKTVTAGAITNAACADDIDVNVKTMTAGVITSTVIADDAITAAKLNTGAITADAFAADAIVAATLATGCLTADAFAANAIEAAAIKDGAITNAKVADDVDVNVKTITNGAITAAAIADAAIDAATFAADVDAKIATMVWNAATGSYGGAGTYGQAVEDTLADTNELQTDWANGGRLDLLLDGATAPTAAAVADAVWDEDLSGHGGAGSAGASLSAAGTAGDPWITALPGSYTSGQAGYIIGNAKTLNAGAVIWTHTETSSLTGLPLEGVEVWYTTDEAGTDVKAYGVTDSSGVATLLIDAGTYSVRRKKGGVSFTNPVSVTVA